jgi:PAS domain S-box-containing protein
VKSSILIVGDRPKIRPDLCDILSADFAVNTCETIKDAEKALAARVYALVIVEAHLQDGRGINLLEAIRAMDAKRRPRVIVLSEDTSTTGRMRSLRAGADIHVGKPYEIAYVLARVRELVHPNKKEGGHHASERSAGSPRKVPAVHENNGPWSAQSEVPPGCLLFRAVIATGISRIIGPRTMARVCSRAGIDPRTSSAADVARALPALREALGIFLPPEQAEEHVAAVAAFAREAGARHPDTRNAAAGLEASFATEDNGAIQPKKRPLLPHRTPIAPGSMFLPPSISKSDAQGALPQVFEHLQRLSAEGHAARERTQTVIEELAALRPSYPPTPMPPTNKDSGARRGAAAAPAESEWGYRSLADALPTIICAATPDGTVDFVNHHLADFLGISVEQALAARWIDFVHPHDRAAASKAWTSAIVAGTSCDVTIRVRRCDGAYRWMVVQASPVRNSSGVVLRWFGAATDIDDVKRAQAKTDSMLEGVSIGVALCDADLCYIIVNKAFAALDGVPPEAHLGRRLDEVGPAMAATVAPLLKHAPDAGEPIKHIELSGSTNGSPDGQRRWLASYYPVKIDGHVMGVMILGVDITEQKRAERADALLARAIGSLSASLDINVTLNHLARIVVPDLADLCIVYLGGGREPVRVAIVAHADPTKAELIRTLCERYPHPPDAPHGYQYVLRTGKPDIVPVMTEEVLASVACNEEHLRLLRELRSTSGVVVPLAGADRIVGAMMLLSWDSGHHFDPSDVPVAEEIGRHLAVAIEHAEEFNAAKEERSRAEEANRLKDEFLAMVSHELRTPLSAVLGWTRMLRAGKVDADRTTKALAMIERNTLAQSQLIEDLLDVGRIVAGKLRLNICPANMPQIIAAAVESMRPAAEAREIVLEEEIDPEATPIMGDAGRLQQIAFNLINNSVKFTPRKGRVKVILRRAGPHIEIAVEDTGRGISPDFLPHIFERFRQAETNVHRSKGGLGLGLAIVKRLVELHGGTIEARSDGEARGATLIVELPVGPLRVARESVEAGTRPSWPPSDCLTFDCRPELEGLSVLVVDDEPDAVQILRSLLEQSKARVTTATNVAEAMMVMTEESRPDVILADIAMPGEDGHAFMRRLRSLPEERGGRTPAVALTAYGGTEAQERALQSGFDQYILKPTDPSELVLTLARAAGRSPA